MTSKPNALSRRGALLAGAGALATPALLRLTPPASAAAPMLGAAAPRFHRFKLGSFEVTTILDGSRTVPGPHPIFGQDRPAEDVAALMEENFLPTDKAQFYFTPTVVNTGSELVLFDTGLGGENGQLVAQLEGAGYSADQIDVVVITHMHPDHIGGILTNGAPTFPNARYVTGQVEFDFWMADEMLSGERADQVKGIRANVEPVADNMTFLGDEGTVVSGVNALAAFGHTPGHMAYHVESEGQRLVIWADTANHFVASIQRPDWHVRFDMDKEAAAATRVRLFELSDTDRVPVIGYHMPFPAIGYVRKAGTSWRWEPVSYQLSVE